MATDQNDHRYQIEMQTTDQAGLVERMTFGQGRLMTDQLKKGHEYWTLKPVISIWILNEPFLGYAWMDAFNYTGMKYGKPLGAPTCLVILDLATWRRMRQLDLTKHQEWDKLEVSIEPWLAFLSASEQLDPQALPESIDTKPLQEAVEIMGVFTKKERERQLYRAREDGARIRRAEIHYGIEKGLKEGLQKGLEQGLEQGIEQGIEKGIEKGLAEGEARGIKQGEHKKALETARILLSKGYPEAEIMEITGLDEAELTALQKV